ncbi:MAG: tol-pal system-associated acyl-CoA thioesterase [Asticcacaulis sp.]
MSDSQPISGIIANGEHRLNIRVYYEDTDFTGLVYHANYLKFFERGRSDYLRLLGVHHHELKAHEDALAFAVIHIDIGYRAPARIDDLITVRTRLIEARGARFVIAQTCALDGEILCEGTVTVACIDAEGRPRRLPKPFADALGRAVATAKPV